MNLTDKHCVPCESGTPLLSENDFIMAAKINKIVGD